MLCGLDLAPPEFPLNNAAAKKSSLLVLSGLFPDFKFDLYEQSSLEFFFSVKLLTARLHPTLATRTLSE